MITVSPIHRRPTWKRIHDVVVSVCLCEEAQVEIVSIFHSLMSRPEAKPFRSGNLIQ